MSATLYNGPTSPQTVRAGVASMEVDGVAVDIASELSYDATLVKNEQLVGQSGVQGYSQSFKAGMMQATLRDAGTMSQAYFASRPAGPVIAILANGKVISGVALIATEIGAVNTVEGTFEVKFEGIVIESSAT